MRKENIIQKASARVREPEFKIKLNTKRSLHQKNYQEIQKGYDTYHRNQDGPMAPCGVNSTRQSRPRPVPRKFKKGRNNDTWSYDRHSRVAVGREAIRLHTILDHL